MLYFRPLGTVHEDVRKNLRGFGLSSEEPKSTMKWCSVSNMICGNMIWRNRCEAGVRPGDSTVSQLISITYTVSKAFDYSPVSTYVLCTLIFQKHSIWYDMKVSFIN